MFEIPYRWSLRTFFLNLKSMIIDIQIGIQNIIKWTPVIWHDKDFDWAYLAKIMEFKMRNMSKNFSKYGHHTTSKKDARNLLICAELLKRLESESYMVYKGNIPLIKDRNLYKKEENIGMYYQQYLGRLIGKHLRCWWD